MALKDVFRNLFKKDKEEELLRQPQPIKVKPLNLDVPEVKQSGMSAIKPQPTQQTLSNAWNNFWTGKGGDALVGVQKFMNLMDDNERGTFKLGEQNALAKRIFNLFDENSPTRKILDIPSSFIAGNIKELNMKNLTDPNMDPLIGVKGGFNSVARDLSTYHKKNSISEDTIMTQLPIKLGVDPKSLPGLGIGLVGEIVAPGFGGDAKAIKKIKDSSELAAVIQKTFKIKPQNLDEGGEGVRLAWKAVEKAVGKALDSNLMKKLKSGEVVEGENFVLQKQGEELLARIGQGLEGSKLPEIKVPKDTKVASKVDDLLVRADIDPAGLNKIGLTKAKQLAKEDVLKPVQEGFQRFYQTISKGADSDWYFDNPNQMVHFVTDTTKADNFKIVDVPVGTFTKDPVRTGVWRDLRKVEAPATEVTKPLQLSLPAKASSGKLRLPDQTKVMGETFEIPDLTRPITPGAAKVEATAQIQKEMSQADKARKIAEETAAKAERLETGEYARYMDTATKAAEEAGTTDILEQAAKRSGDFLSTFRESLASNPEELGRIDIKWNQFLSQASDLTGIRKIYTKVKKMLSDTAKMTGKFGHIPNDVNLNVFKYKFTDPELDSLAKKITMAGERLFSEISQDYTEAKRVAREMLGGRKINQAEYNALLRGEYAKEFEYAQKGAVQTNLGEDILSKAPELEKVFTDVHEDIGGLVLAVEKGLDDLVRKGVLDIDTAEKLRMASPEVYGKNLLNYIKTSYSKVAADLDKYNLNSNTVREIGLDLSSANRKLTDLEWGQAYIAALNKNVPEEVSKALYIPQDLIDAVLRGDENSIKTLGRRVKELRGYIVEADTAFKKTIFPLIKNLKDIEIIKAVTNMPDVFSDVARPGFSLGDNILQGNIAEVFKGKWIRDDVAKELTRDKLLLEKMDDDVLGIVQGYNALWKATHTVFNLPTWITNFFTGMTIMQSAAGNSITNPANWKYYAKGMSEFWSQIPTGKITSGDLRKFVNSAGISGTFSDVEIIQDMQKFASDIGSPDTALAKLAKFVTDNVIAKGSEYAGRFYSYLDASNKYVTYLNKIDKGYSPVEAVDLAQKYHLNYLLAPDFVRSMKQGWGGLVFPFVTFAEEYPRMLAGTLVKAPWRIVPWMIMPRIQTAMWKAQHPDLADKSEQQKPDYLRDNPFVMTIGYDEDSKEFIYVNMAKYFNIPYDAESAYDLAVGPFNEVGGFMSGIGALTTNTDRYGNELNKPGGMTTGEYVAKSVLPVPPMLSTLNDLNDTLQGEAISTTGAVKEPIDVALKLVGLNVYRGDRMQFQRNIEAMKADMGEWKSYAKRVLSDPRASEEAKAQAKAEFKAKYKSTREEIKQLVGGESEGTTQLIDSALQAIFDLELIQMVYAEEGGSDAPTRSPNDLGGTNGERPILDLKDMRGSIKLKKKGSNSFKKVSPIKLTLPKSKPQPYNLRVPELEDPTPPVTKLHMPLRRVPIRL